MMGKVMMSGIVPPLVAPVTGIQLGTIAEGSIVKLNEGGSPVEFYVAKHDYESALNGTGRTLLVRKHRYGTIAWGTNKYAAGALDTWFNGTYKDLLDTKVQEAISTTKFYYTATMGGKVTTLSRSVFALSLTELGKTSDYANVEGTALPIVNTLQKIVDESGTGVDQWTRTIANNESNHAYQVQYGKVLGNLGVVVYRPKTSTLHGSRPAFTLPSGALFDEKTMLFNGKIA